VLLPNGDLQLTLLSKANRTNILEASTRLTNWTAIVNLWNPTGMLRVTNTSSAALSNRFFRARLAP
jgi:hypothetical protein